jgi:hypothetical protein
LGAPSFLNSPSSPNLNCALSQSNSNAPAVPTLQRDGFILGIYPSTLLQLSFNSPSALLNSLHLPSSQQLSIPQGAVYFFHLSKVFSEHLSYAYSCWSFKHFFISAFDFTFTCQKYLWGTCAARTWLFKHSFLSAFDLTFTMPTGYGGPGLYRKRTSTGAYFCKFDCGKTCKSLPGIKTHEARCDDNPDTKTHICPKCGAESKSILLLKQHLSKFCPFNINKNSIAHTREKAERYKILLDALPNSPPHVRLHLGAVSNPLETGLTFPQWFNKFILRLESESTLDNDDLEEIHAKELAQLEVDMAHDDDIFGQSHSMEIDRLETHVTLDGDTLINPSKTDLTLKGDTLNQSHTMEVDHLEDDSKVLLDIP